MKLLELPWTWIGAAAAVVLAVAVLRARTGRRRRGRGDAWASPNPRPDAGPAAAPEQRALLQAANEVRGALERQTQQLAELRASWNRRMDEMERRLGALAPAAAPRGDAWAARPAPSAAHPGEIRDGGSYGGGAQDARTYDGTMRDRTVDGAYDDGGGMFGGGSAGGGGTGGGMTGGGSIGGGGMMGGGTGSGMIGGGGFPSPEPAWSPGPGDQPVEVRDGALVVSRSLPPAGYLSVTGAGQARVYLNADVQLTEFSLPKWAAFFDLQGARPYAAYRTRRPAEVRWDQGAGRGELIHKGLAEAI